MSESGSEPSHGRAASPQPGALEAEVARLGEANGTLTRILDAIEEYVYSGEFLPDGDYVVRFAGPCRDRFLGLAPDAARVARWVDYVHPEELDAFRVAHELALREGALDVRYRLLGADGMTRWVRDRGRIRRVGERVFLDGSVLDVTALHEAEQRLTEHVRDIEVLATAHRELARSSDPAAARHAVCRAVRLVCGATGVGLYEPHGDELRLVDTDGEVPCSTSLETDGVSGTADTFRIGARLFLPEARTSDRARRPTDGSRVSSLLFEPVLSGGLPVGVITVVWADPVPMLPPRVEALLPLLVTEVAVALERAALVDRLSAAAHTDSLTGLPNRRALESLLPQELARARRQGAPLCLAVVDLDRFKVYNDSFGHPAGDVLLRNASGAWRRALRATDALVRFGGEEFLVLLPHCDLPDACRVLEGLRAATPLDQSCSVGVTRWDGDETGAELLHRADQTMYAAKRAGRNRVLAAGSTDPATVRPVGAVPAPASTAITGRGD